MPLSGGERKAHKRDFESARSWQSEGAPMYQMLCVLVATIAYGTATGHCQGSKAGMTAVTFQSSTYSDMRQLLAREATTGAVTVKAYLGFPEQVRDRYPAVIIVHTIAGYRDANEGYAAAELRKAGFATLTYDSFAARGTTGAALQGSSGYLRVGVADAYAALRLLSGEPRIDADRIAIIGFSYGGEVAHLAAFETLRSALNPGPGRFAAHVAFYPGGNFGAVAEPSAYTGSPVLMLLGEKDENLPVTKIESYLAYARAAGDSGPDRNRDLPGRLPCMDGSRPRHRALLPGLRQREKMSAHPARAEAAGFAHRRRGEALRPGRLRCVRRCSTRLFDGI
jgi:dienelactone hydrolase